MTQKKFPSIQFIELLGFIGSLESFELGESTNLTLINFDRQHLLGHFPF